MVEQTRSELTTTETEELKKSVAIDLTQADGDIEELLESEETKEDDEVSNRE